jgi:ribosome-binding factor A
VSRIERLESLIQREVAAVITRRMPHANLGLVSITRVKLAADMTTVVVYYSQFGTDADRQKTRRFLTQAAGFMKGEVGRVMRTHTVPNFQFLYDDSIAKGADMVVRINAIIQDDITS